jgi:hypothetical protein
MLAAWPRIKELELKEGLCQYGSALEDYIEN